MQEQILRWMERGSGPHAVQVVLELAGLCVAVWFMWRVAVRPMAAELRRDWRVWKRYKRIYRGKRAQKKSALVGASTDSRISGIKNKPYIL